MTAWTSEELTRIGTAPQLQIAARRRDGTLRKPVTIWVVRYDDTLYVRSVNGRDAAWFRGALATREGRIWGGGVGKDGTFTEPDNDIGDELDSAYRAKYSESPSSVSHIVSPEARSATMKLVPRSTSC